MIHKFILDKKNILYYYMDNVFYNIKNSKFKIFYPIDNNSSIIRAITNGRLWEKKILKYFDKYVKPNSNTIDIGSYIGTHSLYLSLICNKVIAFEPQILVGKCFEKTIETNNIKNIILNKFALSNNKDEVEFGTNHDGDASLLNQRETKKFKYLYKVKTDTLDNIVDDENISLIKLDAEGEELEILQGGEKLINKNRPVILIEIWKSQKRINNIKNWCKKNKYTFNEISADDYILLPLENI
jgi:FkbM family methyltransferase